MEKTGRYMYMYRGGLVMSLGKVQSELRSSCTDNSEIHNSLLFLITT